VLVLWRGAPGAPRQSRVPIPLIPYLAGFDALGFALGASPRVLSLLMVRARRRLRVL
jgi:hypothetical protein